MRPGIADGAVIDIDDTVQAVYGPDKQGAQFGYTKIRGLNAQLATISAAQAAPMIAATRLRRGDAHSATGAVRMLRDTIATARAGASFTVGMPLNSRVRAAIDTIEESAWVRIEYPLGDPGPADR